MNKTIIVNRRPNNRNPIKTRPKRKTNPPSRKPRSKTTQPVDKASQILQKRKVIRTKNPNMNPINNNLMIPVNADTRDFLYAYFDPFRKGPISLPVPPLLSHQNILAIANGTGICNAQGNGWIVLKPILTVASDIRCASVTNNAAASDDIGFGTTGTADVYCSSPYGEAAYIYTDTPALTVRLVAVGIRVRYTGTTLNAAGNVYTIQLQSRTNEAALNGFNVNDIKNEPAWKEAEFVRNRWHTLARQIQDTCDFMYQCYNAPNFNYIMNPAVASVDMSPNMAIYMAAQPGAPFEYEIFSHFEVVGPDLPTRRVIKSDSKTVESAQNVGMDLRFGNTTTADSGTGVGTTEGKGEGIGAVVKHAATGFLKEATSTLVKEGMGAIFGL
jgi:hypothetical protein